MAEAPSPTSRSLVLRWLPASIAALLLLCGAWMQARVYLNHDVAWVVHGAGWLLDGKRFGSDIIDVNPPLAWFVSIPAALLVRLGWCDEPAALRAYVWMLCAGSLLLGQRALRFMRETGSGAEAAALLIGAAFAMAILPGAAFGQREYLAFVLGLPYCFLIAGRLDGRQPPPRGLAAACGPLAGIAFGFKPWFLAVPILLELLHLQKVRSVRSIMRPETVALASVLVAYLLAVMVFAPDYLAVVIPIAAATYWAYDDALPAWYFLRDAVQPFLFALLFLGVARRLPAAALALIAAFAGFSFSHWAQHKGFAYHAYPALACAMTLFAYATALAARELLQLKLAVSRWAKVAMAACAVIVAVNVARLNWEPVMFWVEINDMKSGLIGKYRSTLIGRIDAVVSRGEYVYAFSSHPFPAFPTMSYTAAEWASPMVGQFVVPAYIARDRLDDPAARAAVERAAQWQRDQVLSDFKRYSPRMVLVETGAERLGMHGQKFDDIAFFGADARFAAIWREYAEVEPAGSLRVFVRDGDRAAAHEWTR